MKHPLTAVAIRYVHDPRTEEFLNIGFVLFCERHGLAGARFLSRWGRVTAAFAGADLPLLRRMARSSARAKIARWWCARSSISRQHTTRSRSSKAPCARKPTLSPRTEATRSSRRSRQTCARNQATDDS